MCYAVTKLCEPIQFVSQLGSFTVVIWKGIN